MYLINDCIVPFILDPGGAWKLYKNGEPVAGENSSSSIALAQKSYIKAGGDLTIGHMIHHLGEKKKELRGELSHVHVWNTTLNDTYIKYMAQDCTFTYCCNVAEWVDFRSGTRGTVKLRWPSKVFGKPLEGQLVVACFAEALPYRLNLNLTSM